MLEAASFSLRALLDFHPRVRGGDGIEMSSGSEVSTESLEGIETARSAGPSGSEARISLATTDYGGARS